MNETLSSENVFSTFTESFERNYKAKTAMEIEPSLNSFETFASHVMLQNRTLAREEQYCITLKEHLVISDTENCQLQREIDTLSENLDSYKRRHALLVATRTRLEESVSLSREKAKLEEKEKELCKEERQSLTHKISSTKERYHHTLETLKNEFPKELDSDRGELMAKRFTLHRKRNELQEKLNSMKTNNNNKTENKDWNLWKEHVIRVAELLRSKISLQTPSNKRCHPTIGLTAHERGVTNFKDDHFPSSLQKRKENPFTLKIIPQLSPIHKRFGNSADVSEARNSPTLSRSNVERAKNFPSVFKLKNLNLPQLKVPCFKTFNKNIPRRDQIHHQPPQNVKTQPLQKELTTKKTTSFIPSRLTLISLPAGPHDQNTSSKDDKFNETIAGPQNYSPKRNVAEDVDRVNKNSEDGAESIVSEENTQNAKRFEIARKNLLFTLPPNLTKPSCENQEREGERALVSPFFSPKPTQTSSPSISFHSTKAITATSLSGSLIVPEKESVQNSNHQSNVIRAKMNHQRNEQEPSRRIGENCELDEQSIQMEIDDHPLEYESEEPVTSPKRGTAVSNLQKETRYDLIEEHPSSRSPKSCVSQMVGTIPMENERRAYVRSHLRTPDFSCHPANNSVKALVQKEASEVSAEEVNNDEKRNESAMAIFGQELNKESAIDDENSMTMEGASLLTTIPQHQPEFDFEPMESGTPISAIPKQQQQQHTGFGSFLSSDAHYEGTPNERESSFNFNLFDQRDLSVPSYSQSALSLFGSPAINETASSSLSEGRSFSLFGNDPADVSFCGEDNRQRSTFDFNFGSCNNGTTAPKSSNNFFSIFSSSEEDQDSNPSSSQPTFKLF